MAKKIVSTPDGMMSEGMKLVLDYMRREADGLGIVRMKQRDIGVNAGIKKHDIQSIIEALRDRRLIQPIGIAQYMVRMNSHV